MSETSSIDDVLLNLSTTTPPKLHSSDDDVPHETFIDEPVEEKAVEAEPESEPEAKKVDESSVDEYGNEKPSAKNYTQEEADEYANRIVRERLARMERSAQPSPQQQAQQQNNPGFEYNAESNDSWQQQLESFVEQTINKVGQKQNYEREQRHREQEHAEFQMKFQSGMHRFNDFVEVVSSQPITDPMTEALSGIKDPSAFIYAASKRMPQELERISKLPNKAAQMVEMGKLEERMKLNKTPTKAPRPIGRTQEDMTIQHSKERREPTIEERIAESDAKRRALQAQRRR